MSDHRHTLGGKRNCADCMREQADELKSDLTKCLGALEDISRCEFPGEKTYIKLKSDKARMQLRASEALRREE